MEYGSPAKDAVLGEMGRRYLALPSPLDLADKYGVGLTAGRLVSLRSQIIETYGIKDFSGVDFEAYPGVIQGEFFHTTSRLAESHPIGFLDYDSTSVIHPKMVLNLIGLIDHWNIGSPDLVLRVWSVCRGLDEEKRQKFWFHLIDYFIASYKFTKLKALYYHGRTKRNGARTRMEVIQFCGRAKRLPDPTSSHYQKQTRIKTELLGTLIQVPQRVQKAPQEPKQLQLAI